MDGIKTFEDAMSFFRKKVIVDTEGNGTMVDEGQNKISASGPFKAEINKLKKCSLPVLTQKETYLALFITQNDYPLFWDTYEQTNMDKIVWAFEPTNFYQRCYEKGIMNMVNRAHTEEELRHRIEALLGLPLTPDKSKEQGKQEIHSHFVLVKVKTENLFRAAYNPNVSQQIGDINSFEQLASVKYLASKDTDAEKEIKDAWIDQQKNKFPWTRLGYTFDWMGENDEGNIPWYYGVASYIIKPGSELLPFKTTGGRVCLYEMKDFFTKEISVKYMMNMDSFI